MRPDTICGTLLGFDRQLEVCLDLTGSIQLRECLLRTSMKFVQRDSPGVVESACKQLVEGSFDFIVHLAGAM